MASLAELWQQVAESPGDLAARLVLADALIDAGDPRGELITLQCGGADASVQVLRDEGRIHDNIAERLNDLIAAHWDTWLGELALVLHRQGTQFRDGMLASIHVGCEDAAPEHLWDALGGHRELCALQQVRPRKVGAERYGRFLAALVRDPPWVEIRQGALAAIAARRGRWAVPAVRYSGPWDLDGSGAELHQLAALDPELERLELAPLWITAEQAHALTATVERLPALFPRLAAIRLEGTAWSLRDLDERQLARLAAMPMVELVS